MNAIAISGVCFIVGKTQLSRALCKLLSGAARITIGNYMRKSDSDGHIYYIGTGFSIIATEHSNARFLIIESNRIFEQITPQYAI